VRKLACAGRL